MLNEDSNTEGGERKVYALRTDDGDLLLFLVSRLRKCTGVEEGDSEVPMIANGDAFL